MIGVTRTITRVTDVIDHRTNQPFVLQLVAGGKLVRIRPKGCRRWFTVTVRQIWMEGARNAVAEQQAGRRAARTKEARA